jgi:catechol 2,3-dioxygenase-like lactoylglutathione lyase family enzyme
MVRVSNLESALDFYCTKLGLVELRRTESPQGRFTLVFLAAPVDAEDGERDFSPLLELTWNWDPETYTGGRNFGHLRAVSAAPRPRRHHQPPASGWPYGIRPVSGWDIHRTSAGRCRAAAAGTLVIHAEYRRVVIRLQRADR